MGPMLGGIKEAPNLWSFWGSDFPKIIRALSLGPGVIWRPLIYNLKFVIKTDSSIGAFFFALGQVQGTFFFPKRDYKASAFFLLVFEVWDLTVWTTGGHPQPVRGGFHSQVWDGPKTMEKTQQQINTSSMLGAWIFLFQVQGGAQEPTCLSIFLVNLGKNIPTPWILLGYLVSLTASKERISRLFSPGFQNRRERRPVKWCSALFFGGYVKIRWETCQTTFSNPKKVRWGEERQQYPVDGFFECKIFPFSEVLIVRSLS